MPNSIIIVVAYDDKVREMLVKSLERFAVTAISCSTFCQAESYLLAECCQGMLVDLVTMIKSKGEEKIVAHTVTSFFPTLRVRAMGTMLVPVTMPGEAKQDTSLDDFLGKTCAEFPPRRLRFYRRKEICLPALITAVGSPEEPIRGFTQNISWRGAFIVDMNPERFDVGAVASVCFPDFPLIMEVIVVSVVPWGAGRSPGIGVRFTSGEGEIRSCLAKRLQSSEDADRDRLTA